MRSRLSSVILFSVLAAVPFLHTGCGPQSAMPYAAEVDDPDYRRGKELLRMGREQEALATFLKLIDQRGGAAAESHLEAAILYQQQVKDPIASIYHYRRYRELRPNTEQAKLALQRIEACIRDFARTLPGQPMDNQEDRTTMIDAIDRLQRENFQLKEQLQGARAAILDSARQASNGATDRGIVFPGTDGEPSQGFAMDAPTGAQPEYSAPVGVVPVPMPAPAPETRQIAPPPTQPATPPAAAVRKHTVSKGDTLMSISQRYYGNRSRWKEIFAANRDVLPAENALKIGMELKIPQ